METTSSDDTGVAVDLLAGKWQLKILICLCQAKTARFNELRRMLPGISNNMLSQCLREFERYKVVSRTQYEEIPPRVEYSLTELGQELRPVVHLLNEWGKKVQEVNGASEESDVREGSETNEACDVS